MLSVYWESTVTSLRLGAARSHRVQSPQRNRFPTLVRSNWKWRQLKKTLQFSIWNNSLERSIIDFSNKHSMTGNGCGTGSGIASDQEIWASVSSICLRMCLYDPIWALSIFLCNRVGVGRGCFWNTGSRVSFSFNFCNAGKWFQLTHFLHVVQQQHVLTHSRNDLTFWVLQ